MERVEASILKRADGREIRVYASCGLRSNTLCRSGAYTICKPCMLGVILPAKLGHLEHQLHRHWLERGLISAKHARNVFEATLTTILITKFESNWSLWIAPTRVRLR